MSELRDALKQRLLPGETIKTALERVRIHFARSGFINPLEKSFAWGGSFGAVALTDRRLVAIWREQDDGWGSFQCKAVYALIEMPGNDRASIKVEPGVVLQCPGGIAIILSSREDRQEIRDFASRALLDLNDPPQQDDVLAAVESEREAEADTEEYFEAQAKAEEEEEQRKRDLLL